MLGAPWTCPRIYQHVNRSINMSPYLLGRPEANLLEASGGAEPPPQEKISRSTCSSTSTFWSPFESLWLSLRITILWTAPGDLFCLKCFTILFTGYHLCRQPLESMFRCLDMRMHSIPWIWTWCHQFCMDLFSSRVYSIWFHWSPCNFIESHGIWMDVIDVAAPGYHLVCLRSFLGVS